MPLSLESESGYKFISSKFVTRNDLSPKYTQFVPCGCHLRPSKMSENDPIANRTKTIPRGTYLTQHCTHKHSSLLLSFMNSFNTYNIQIKNATVTPVIFNLDRAKAKSVRNVCNVSAGIRNVTKQGSAVELLALPCVLLLCTIFRFFLFSPSSSASFILAFSKANLIGRSLILIIILNSDHRHSVFLFKVLSIVGLQSRVTAPHMTASSIICPNAAI